MRFWVSVQGIVCSYAYARPTDALFDHVPVQKSIEGAFGNCLSSNYLLY
jgi:hypothetical protein